MNLFTEKELIIMGSVIGFLLLVCLVLIVVDIISKKKKNDIEDDLETINVLETKENLTTKNNNEELEILEVKEEDNVETLIQDEIEDLIMEVEPLVNVVKIETLDDVDKQQKAQIELLKIEEELEQNFSLEDTITNLEAIEEENAIISYQELLENTSQFDKVLTDDGDEPITINEVFSLLNQENEEKIINEIESIPLNEAYNGDFKSTPYVSPINGLEFQSLSEIQLENTANLEKLDKEIRKTNEFLNILNELKKNLE